MAKRIRISACLVVYNEERVIERCLKSLKGAVDEIVLVHDGPCTDRTLRIARAYTDKVHTCPRVGEAEPHRMFSFSKASGEWILQIDADEYLSEGLRRGLRKLAEEGEREGVAAYRLASDVIVSGKLLKRAGLGNAYHLCLFRKGAVRYEGMFHEIPHVKGAIRQSELVLHHRQPYDNYSLQTFRRKWLPWAYKQAGFSIEKKKARMPALLYLPKAALMLLFYTGYYLILKKGFLNGFTGLKLSLFQGLYNFFVCWYTFRIQAFGRAKKEEPGRAP